MTIQRVAVVFDNTMRPETTGLYVRRALGELVEVEHLLPDDFENVPAGRFDLFLQVDDGMHYTLPAHLKPSAVWVIDTHMDFESALLKAKAVDHVFAAQKDGAARLRQHGINAFWLPLACDPEIHRPHDVAKEHEVCFVGNLFPGPREDLLAAIRRRYPRTFIGRCYLDDMARTYSASKIVFNRSLKNDVNMRVFEALACGSVLVTNEITGNGQDELFSDGVHCVMYRDETDLLKQLHWLLSDETARRRIAAAGRREVLARHTYRHRVERILSHIAIRHTASQVQSTSPLSKEHSTMTTANKDVSYFQHTRPEILERIPKTAQRVLDVGCGAGALGAALKQRQAVEVWGIERDPDIAESAKDRLDRVLCGDAEQIAEQLENETFDAIVCGDVLEHLRDPLTFLRRARGWLSDDGVLIASLPNVRHHSVIRSLLDGNWTYEPAGLLDDDHVRFFTRREIEKLFFRTGFEVFVQTVIPGPGHAEWQQQGRPLDIRVGGLTYRARDDRDAVDLFAYQYLIEARPQPSPEFGLTSIVLATHNQWPHTYACLQSIRHVTDEPYELIVVDNNSTDGTPDHLATMPDVTLVRNDKNRGFPAAVNQGLEAAKGEQVLLLNNDTVVTTGWLRRMLTALHSRPDIGLVGPLSNNVSGEQQIDVGYDGMESLDGFAWQLSQDYAGQIRETDRLVGFCLLIKRAVLDKIGGLDERFGIGNYEDDDYCRRAIQAGYRAVIARDAFVHHVGSATFRNSDVDFGKLLHDNRKKYDEKWNEPKADSGKPKAENATDKQQSSIPDSGSSFDNLQSSIPNPPTLSLCMIVRDNETTIGPALKSIKPFVDEMIVVDTGSTDRTPEICRELGAKVFEFPWCDDFSAARNESLKHAAGEWLFWMDSDDTIPATCGKELRTLADGVHDADVLGYVMQVHCPSAGDPHDVTVVDHVKLFRNRPDLRFEHRIHEQILPAIRRAAGDVRFTDIHVVHSGSDQTPAGRVRKLERDYKLLKLDLKERPDHPFVLFNLGMTYADDDRPTLAIQYLRRCLAVSQSTESHVRKAYALLIGALCQTGRHEEAETTCQTALAMTPDDKELLFRQAMLQQHFGRLEEAAETYRRVLDDPANRHFASVDAAIAGYKARHNLALVYQELGKRAEAIDQWRLVTKEQPDFRPAWRGLAELALETGDGGIVKPLIEQLENHPTLKAEAAILAARRLESRQSIAEARHTLEATITNCPDDIEPLRELARLVFEHQGPAAAEGILQQLAERDPEDASARHNLGNVYLATDRPETAADILQQSVEIRPEAAATWQLLGHALERCGRQDEAEAAWKQAHDRDPNAATVAA